MKIVTKKSPRGGSRMGASPSSRRLNNGYNLSNVSEDKEYISPTNSAIVKPPLEGKPINPEKIQGQERTCDESSIKKSKRKGSFTDTFGKKEESKCVKSLEVKIKPISIVDNHNVSTKSPEVEVAGDSDRVGEKEPQQQQQQQQQQHDIANVEKERSQMKEIRSMKRLMSQNMWT